ncbi:hypothetical protein XM38_041960 [Halomicronema hongdechloris C2206]|uniref:SGNH hydrolase-type esterase domain-containing protein n=1 Tax=Halomicronema hongdechloris C2206 TaxID=1641165 RepID=A0A1Z3HSF4_9CYAN|nr:GDSL-type esterase/lipase family protein [Halomicronema hongdechloris]ASC73234.1 hypothetical protein XM38_041960 [Halomicronema hongdechloris C2206]
MTSPLKRAIALLIATVTTLTLTTRSVHSDSPDTPVRVLVYGDSNTWGWVPTESGFPTTRFLSEQRFPGVMQRELGPEFDIIENGLNNRTTNLDFPEAIDLVAGGGFNGARTLPGLLAAHAPLDWVVIMLGTNDLRAPFHRTATEAAAAIAPLIDIVHDSGGSVANTYDAPRVLIVAPPRIGNMPHPEMAAAFSDAERTSQGFAAAYAAVAEAAAVPFLDATEIIGVTAGWDGIHLSAEQHQRLGQTLAIALYTSTASAPD